MKQLRVIRNALREIRRKPTRTFLTTLGIVIGIGAVITLMEVGNGAQESLRKSIAAMGVNTINIRPGNIQRAGVNSGAGARANLTGKDIIAILKGSEHVAHVTPVVSVRGQVVYGGLNWSPFYINGVAPSYFQIANWQIDEGVFFDDTMTSRAMKVCVIGSTIRKELFSGVNPVGREIRIQNVLFKVIGVMKSKGANMMGMDQDDIVVAPWTTVKSRLRGAGQSSISAAGTAATAASTSSTYTSGVSFYPPVSSAGIPPVRFENFDSLLASSTSPETTQLAVGEITAALRTSHKIKDEDPDDFTIRTMEEFSRFLTDSTKSTTNLLLCVAFVSLVVGGVGIMNIMLVSVTERTREIGLRMAVGARKRDILQQFLIESIVICIMGGIIGILLGHFSSLLFAFYLNWPTSTSYVAILLSVGVSALVGIVFGYYPAWKAARLDPIEALRYE